MRRGRGSPIVCGLLTTMLVGAGCSSSGSKTTGDSGGTTKDSGKTPDRGTVVIDTGATPADSAAPDTSLPPLVGEGHAVGQISKNWTLKDRSGNPVNLHDFQGKVIYLESGAEW